MKVLTVYALSDPRTGDIRYVGLTTRTAEARLKEHISHAYRRALGFGLWIDDLASLGMRPDTVVLETSPRDAEDAEGRWIAEYIARGAQLLNTAIEGGSRGFKQTEAWKRENSKRMTGRIVSEETRRKIAAAKTGKPRPDLAERNRKSARLSVEQVAEIRRRLIAGERGVRLAAEFGVSAPVVCLIRQNKRR